MCQSPVVASPNFDCEFVLQCDASDASAAAALTQIQDGQEVIIAFFSHKWTAPEKSWCATEKEGASVLKAIQHFRGYIYGMPFTVITDAKALTHIKTIRTDGSSRLSRWALELNQYPITIKHRAGRLFVAPDALNRAVNMITKEGDKEDTRDEWLETMKTRIDQDPTRYASKICTQPDYSSYRQGLL